MKRFIWLLIIVLLALGIAWIMLNHPGYVLVHVGQLSIASPLWLFLLGLVILLIVLRIVWSFVRLWLILPRGLRAKYALRKGNKQQNLLLQAINLTLLEDWQQAEKAFKKLSDMKFMSRQSLLLASMCAKRNDQKDVSLDYLHQASELKGRDNEVILIAQIDALMEDHRWDQAQQKVDLLLSKDAKNPYGLYRWFDILLQRQQWQKAINVLRRLKTAPLDEKKRERMTKRAYKGLIKHASKKSQQALELVWEDLPKSIKNKPAITGYYVKKLLVLGDSIQAEDILRKYLSSQWNEGLFALYGYAISKDSEAQLKRAEKWWKNIEPTATALLTMGNLCQDNQQNDRALKYYERSISVKPNKETYLALGQLQAQLQMVNEALENYHQAALITD